MSHYQITEHALKPGDNEIGLPFGAEVISVACVDGKILLWAFEPEPTLDTLVPPRRIRVLERLARTEVETAEGRFLATVVVPVPSVFDLLGGMGASASVQVWHVFELQRSGQ